MLKRQCLVAEHAIRNVVDDIRDVSSRQPRRKKDVGTRGMLNTTPAMH